MTDRFTDEPTGLGGELVHLPPRRSQQSVRDQVAQEVELSIAAHFREQNELLRDMNKNLSEKVQRLTTGVERLVAEMHGVRTGNREEAFARVGPSGASPDLPTVAAEAAVIYVHTAGDIGEELGFRASQIGLLLGARGLGWAGNGDYQELTRHKKKSQTKFWHRDVPDRLRAILDQGSPDKHGISDGSVLAMFRQWRQRKANLDVLERLTPTDSPH